MRLENHFRCLGMMFYLTVAICVAGCSKGENPTVSLPTNGKTDSAKAGAKTATEDHGWWCEEHGIPEEICGLCNGEYRSKRKAEGDWCEVHARLKSQCFKCDPSLYEKVFEPMYVAKYGKKPKRPPESEFTK